MAKQIQNSKLPDFVIAGAQRAGTTWLCKALIEHPEVVIGRGENIKEINFFDIDSNWSKGADWYASHFDVSCDQQVVGEATTEYMYCPVAAERMASLIPDAKVIMILREPVDRAYSAYWLFRDRYYGMNFKQALKHNDGELLRRGMYAEQIRRFRNYYPDEQLLILFYDELKSNNQNFVSKVFGFLGIQGDFSPSIINSSYNAVIYPHLQDKLKRFGLEWLITVAKKSGVGAIIRKLNRKGKGSSYPELDDETRKELEDYFHQPNLELQRELERKLPWL